jgi:hypothetical protein
VDHLKFESEVAAAFQYLVDVYGFKRRLIQVIAYERFVEFEKPSAKVIVHQELGGAPAVSLVAPNSIRRGARREFGLHELEQELKRLGLLHGTASSHTNENVQDLARTLQQIGPDVLSGDFSVLFTRLQRHVDAVERTCSAP